MTRHMRSGVQFFMCGTMLILKVSDFGAFQASDFQMRDYQSMWPYLGHDCTWHWLCTPRWSHWTQLPRSCCLGQPQWRGPWLQVCPYLLWQRKKKSMEFSSEWKMGWWEYDRQRILSNHVDRKLRILWSARTPLRSQASSELRHQGAPTTPSLLCWNSSQGLECKAPEGIYLLPCVFCD